MKATIRYNIDPLGQYNDKQIEEVMRKISFWYIVENNPNGLNYEVFLLKLIE